MSVYIEGTLSTIKAVKAGDKRPNGEPYKNDGYFITVSTKNDDSILDASVWNTAYGRGIWATARNAKSGDRVIVETDMKGFIKTFSKC